MFGNKGACLNYNLLGVCKDRTCSYRHSRAQPTAKRIKAMTDKLKPAVQQFMTAGAPTNPNHTKRKRTVQQARPAPTLMPDLAQKMPGKARPPDNVFVPAPAAVTPAWWLAVTESKLKWLSPKWTHPKWMELPSKRNQMYGSHASSKKSKLIIP
jgi:predicted exporter